jgi:hypothetical protein
MVSLESREADDVSAMGKDAGKKRDVDDVDGIGRGEEEFASKQGRAGERKDRMVVDTHMIAKRGVLRGRVRNMSCERRQEKSGQGMKTWDRQRQE